MARKYRQKKRPMRRMYRRKASARLAPKTAIAVRKIVKSQMNQVVETKAVDYITEAIILNHNTPQTIDNDLFYSSHGVADYTGSQASVGTSFGNRIGDSIYAKAASLKMFFDQYNDRPNLVFRITVLRIKAGANIITPASNAFAHPQTTNYLMAPVDTENNLLYHPAPVVMDRRFTVNYGTSITPPAKSCHTFRQFFVKVNKKLKFNSNQPNTVGPFAIQVILTAYDSYGSLITDNVCRVMYSRRAWYQDA